MSRSSEECRVTRKEVHNRIFLNKNNSNFPGFRVFHHYFGSEHSLRQNIEQECEYHRATSFQVSLCQERCPSSTGISTQLYNEIYSAEL